MSAVIFCAFAAARSRSAASGDCIVCCLELPGQTKRSALLERNFKSQISAASATKRAEEQKAEDAERIREESRAKAEAKGAAKRQADRVEWYKERTEQAQAEVAKATDEKEQALAQVRRLTRLLPTAAASHSL